MPYEAPKPVLRPKLSPPVADVVAVVVICFVALALILGASFAVWALQ